MVVVVVAGGGGGWWVRGMASELAGGHSSPETVMGLQLRNHALELELKSSMDKALESMVTLETALRSGPSTSGDVGGSEADGGGGSSWSKRAAAKELELRWQLERGGGGGGGLGTRGSSGLLGVEGGLITGGVATADAMLMPGREHEIRARAKRIEREVALQRAAAGARGGGGGTSSSPSPGPGSLRHNLHRLEQRQQQHAAPSSASPFISSSSLLSSSSSEGELRRHVVDLQMQLGECMQRLSEERAARRADASTSHVLRENERLRRENATLHAALARAGSAGSGEAAGQALQDAIARAQMDVESANERARKMETALAEMVRGASSATDIIVDLAARENGLTPSGEYSRVKEDDFTF